MGALCLGAEVFDWRRFPNTRSFMAFIALTCSEDSTGLSELRGAITHAGNSHIRGQLCEAAWSYQHRLALGSTIARRQDGVHPGHRRPIVDGADPAMPTIRCPCGPQEREVGRGHRRRPRARRFPVG
jgi:hypothetical protein